MIIYSDGRNLQKDKHHCHSTVLGFMLVWPNSILSSVKTKKTHMEFTKKRLKYSEKQDYLVWWTSIQFEGNQLCSSPAEYHPKSRVCWQQHHAVGMFFSGRDWRTRQNRRKAQCTKILRFLNENPVQGSDGQKVHLQQDYDPKNSKSGL